MHSAHAVHCACCALLDSVQSLRWRGIAFMMFLVVSLVIAILLRREMKLANETSAIKAHMRNNMKTAHFCVWPISAASDYRYLTASMLLCDKERKPIVSACWFVYCMAVELRMTKKSFLLRLSVTLQILCTGSRIMSQH